MTPHLTARKIVLGLVSVCSVAALSGCSAAARETEWPLPLPPTTATQPPELGVLQDWNERRAAAYASGSLDELRGLYVRGAGRADLRILRGYVDRGLVVHALESQLRSFDVQESSPEGLTLLVRDRTIGGRAVSGDAEMPLPVSRFAERTIELRLVDDVWRVAEVRRARP